jgi:O-antigen ligase
MPAWLTDFLGDRIQINSLLIVLCFVSVLALSSQSAASYPSYLLALSMVFTFRSWNDVFLSPLVWMIVALLVYLCASTLWSDDPPLRDLIGIVIRGLLVLLFVVALAECQLRGQVQRWLARALAVVGSVAAAAAIVWYVVEPNTHERLFGLGQLDNPVVAALVFSAVIILVLHMLFVETEKPWRIVALVSLLVVVSAVVLTGSRNSWVSIGCAVGVLVLAHRTRDRQRFIAGVVSLLVIAAVLVFAILSNDATREILLPRGDSFRIDIWSYAIGHTWEAGKWFGFGILTPDQVPVGDRMFSHPHSMYASLFFQGGIVGLTLFLVVTLHAIQILVQEYQSDSAKLGLGLLVLALVSYLLDGHELVDKVGETWFLYWLAIGLALGLQWSRFVDQSD